MLRVCLRNARRTETIIPASIVSRKTTKNTVVCKLPGVERGMFLIGSRGLEDGEFLEIWGL